MKWEIFKAKFNGVWVALHLMATHLGRGYVFYLFRFHRAQEVSKYKDSGFSPYHFDFNRSEHEQRVLFVFVPANEVSLRGTLSKKKKLFK